MKRTMSSLAIAAVLAFGAAQFGALSGQPPDDLGVRDGQLKPPSVTRNSVSSQADLHAGHPQQEYALIDPLPFKPLGPEASMQALENALVRLDGVQIVERGPTYIRAEAQTRWLKFVDDLEFWQNASDNTIEVRSASRLGREDFGANRARVERLRAAYLGLP
ncbi:MAG: DUF1499 domain-containing protein [Hydrogenophaga sp.]|jgi:uncharacterized protein (DUF1499 family)|nr:DUF1499 domain-containing protein [Hydrogenophaga sp.]